MQDLVIEIDEMMHRSGIAGLTTGLKVSTDNKTVVVVYLTDQVTHALVIIPSGIIHTWMSVSPNVYEHKCVTRSARSTISASGRWQSSCTSSLVVRGCM